MPIAARPWILLFALLAGVSIASAAQDRHIPRQTFPATAAVQGMVTTEHLTTEQGLGLGGVAVLLQNLTTGRSLSATTAASKPRPKSTSIT